MRKPLAVRATIDERFGHVVAFNEDGEALLTMVDLGLVLDMQHGVEFTPAAARELADCLNKWADRKSTQERKAS